MQWEDRIGRRIKFRDLHIVLAVAQSGSMVKAAETLAISQPVVSKVIGDLERALGVRLFDRSRKGVEPTTSGRALLNCARAAFDLLKQGVKEIEFLNDPTAGELRVGSSPAQVDGVVLAVIDKLSRQYPRMVFHVVPAGTLALYDELRARRVELAFAPIAELVAKDNLDTEVLYDEPLVVVVGVENPWARRRKIALAELVNERWTWPSAGTFFDSLVVEAFRATGIDPPRAAVHVDPFSMRLRLAETGRFLAVVPESIARFPTKHTAVKVLPVELPRTQRQIGIVTLKNRALSPLAQLFIECARNTAKMVRR